MPPRRKGEVLSELIRRAQERKASPSREPIMEDDPRFIPEAMGNRRWGKKYRGPGNYTKGRGRPD